MNQLTIPISNTECMSCNDTILQRLTITRTIKLIWESSSENDMTITPLSPLSPITSVSHISPVSPVPSATPLTPLTPMTFVSQVYYNSSFGSFPSSPI